MFAVNGVNVPPAVQVTIVGFIYKKVFEYNYFNFSLTLLVIYFTILISACFETHDCCSSLRSYYWTCKTAPVKRQCPTACGICGVAQVANPNCKNHYGDGYCDPRWRYCWLGFMKRGCAKTCGRC